MRDAVFMLAMPVLLGLYGLALVLNLFGAASSETDFYRGRGEWYPVLDGDQQSTHRLMGSVMLGISAVSIAAIVATGIVQLG